MNTLQIKSRVDQLQNELRGIEAGAKAAGRDLSADEVARVDEIRTEGDRLKTRYREAKGDEELRKQIDDLGGPAPDSTDTGHLPARVKATGGSGGWADSWTKSQQYGGKTLLSPGTVPVTVPLRSDPIRESEPVLGLRQVIPTVGNTTGTFSFLRQILRDNNARTVAKGTRKPKSEYTLDRVDGRVSTIAHLSEPLDRADLQDATQLRQFIETELRHGWELALEDEILNGDGSTTGGADRFTGLLETSGIQTQAFTDNRFATARRAIAKLENLSLTPTAWIMTPDEWLEFELSTVGTQEAYALDPSGNRAPVDRVARRLWGTPVVLTVSAPDDEAVLLDASSTRLHMREDASLSMTEGAYVEDLFGEGEHGSLFEANKIQFRLEGRAGLEVSRPAGVVKTALTAA